MWSYADFLSTRFMSTSPPATRSSSSRRSSLSPSSSSSSRTLQEPRPRPQRCVSSIDTLKKAQLPNRYRGELIDSAPSTSASGAPPRPLNVHVQVNTSGEALKSGCARGPDAVSLCRSVEKAATTCGY